MFLLVAIQISYDSLPVIELDASVNMTSGYKLPSGAKCLLRDGDFLYAGCQDGGLYGRYQ
jgi:hypothetical protein